MRQVFNITNGAVLVLSSTTEPKTMADNVLSSLLNWDDANVSYETAPKMIGQGSYEIAFTIPERVVEIVINYVGNWKPVVRNLRSLAIAGTELTFTRLTSGTGDGTSELQTLKGKITTVTEPTARGGWTDIKIVVLCKDPTPVTTIS